MAMRGASLATRFALSIYMARFMGFADLGLFGLVAGIAGVAPALLGFGISYFVNRELLQLPRDDGYILIRDRFLWNTVVALVVWIFGLALALIGILPTTPGVLLIASIVTLEYLSFDLHVALINMRRPLAANFLLFFRSAAWILPAIFLGFSDVRLRTLNTIFISWLGALTTSYALAAVMLRDAPWRLLASHPVDWQRLRNMMTLEPLVYCNDLASTGQTYLERFIVAQILGIPAAGLYTLYFSVTQGLYVLVATAVTQLSTPRLSDAWIKNGRGEFDSVLRCEAKRALFFSVPVIAGALVMLLTVLPLFGFNGFNEHVSLLIFMVAAAFLKPFADLLLSQLYILKADAMIARSNIAALALSVVITLLGVHIFGLIGVGLSGLGTQLALIGMRTAVLRFAYLAN